MAPCWVSRCCSRSRPDSSSAPCPLCDSQHQPGDRHSRRGPAGEKAGQAPRARALLVDSRDGDRGDVADRRGFSSCGAFTTSARRSRFRSPELFTASTLAPPEPPIPDRADLVRFYQEVGDEIASLAGVKRRALCGCFRWPMKSAMPAWRSKGSRPRASPTAQRTGRWLHPDTSRPELKLVQGRFFDQHRHPDGVQVIAINQALAEPVLSRRGSDRPADQVGGPDTPWRTIVGVVGDTRHHGLLGPIKREWFVPHNQLANSWGGTRRAMTMVVRTTQDPSLLLARSGGWWRPGIPTFPLSSIATMDEVMAGAVQSSASPLP